MAHSLHIFSVVYFHFRRLFLLTIIFTILTLHFRNICKSKETSSTIIFCSQFQCITNRTLFYDFGCLKPLPVECFPLWNTESKVNTLQMILCFYNAFCLYVGAVGRATLCGHFLSLARICPLLVLATRYRISDGTQAIYSNLNVLIDQTPTTWIRIFVVNIRKIARRFVWPERKTKIRLILTESTASLFLDAFDYWSISRIFYQIIHFIRQLFNIRINVNKLFRFLKLSTIWIWISRLFHE